MGVYYLRKGNILWNVRVWGGIKRFSYVLHVCVLCSVHMRAHMYIACIDVHAHTHIYILNNTPPTQRAHTLHVLSLRSVKEVILEVD